MPQDRPRMVQVPRLQAAGAGSPAASAPPSSLVLVNLEGGDSFIFRLFPEEIALAGRVNWEPQRVARRPSPLLYGGREPRELNFPALWLDNTHTGDSVEPEIAQLFALQDAPPGKGAPPALLARWGASRFRGVLTEIRLTERHFTRAGDPLRAELSITLLELQDDYRQQPSTRQPAQPRQPLGGQVTTGGRGPVQ